MLRGSLHRDRRDKSRRVYQFDLTWLPEARIKKFRLVGLASLVEGTGSKW